MIQKTTPARVHPGRTRATFRVMDARPIAFDNSYARLPHGFFVPQPPTPVQDPSLFALNADLAVGLGLDPAWLSGPDGLAMLSGNAMPPGATPIAQVYAGHQFGGWVPRLGDGRAVLLGEIIDRSGRRRDLQLKGSGPTPFSRMGDGRAWLGPVLREYLVSEAMHAMRIPTTRALAAVTTGEVVLREAAFPGAVLTRVAASHIRVGTFQYFAARGDSEALRVLTEHVIARHHPEAEGPLGLLDAVVSAQARLVADWMSVGFVHGVMNTDNTTVSGETIDYGPCAFLDIYDPGKVFSSIDAYGRYAYNRQADVMLWNLAQFASALLPAIDGDAEAAVAAATSSVQRFPDLFRAAWQARFLAKIGIAEPRPGDEALLQRLLDLMATGGADFTNAFRALGSEKARDQFADRPSFDAWQRDWRARIADEADPETTLARSNPAVIPRNHRIEEAIQAALNGDREPFDRLVRVLAHPFDLAPEHADLARPPSAAEEVRQTFCGT